MTEQIIWANWGYIKGTFQESPALYILDSRIVEVGSRSTLTEKYPEATVFGSGELLMLPGLVNSHDHGRALGTLSLGIPDSLLEVWIDNLGILPHLSPQLAATYEGLQLIHSGVTSVAHSHNPASFETMFEEVPETLKGYRAAGIRVAMHPPITDQNRLIYDDRERFLASVPHELRLTAAEAMLSTRFSADDYFQELQRLFNQHHDTDEQWVHVQVSPVGGQWASDALILRAVEWAKAQGTRVQMHMLETPFQRQYAFRKWGKSFIQHLGEIGALGPWLTLAHMVWIEDTDIPLLAERGVSTAHNPSSNLRLRSGIAPIAALHHGGVRIGIGLDGHGLDEDQDYLREMRLAFTLANQPGATALDISPLTIFDMASQQGAKVTFGDNTRLGLLAEGYLADIVLLDWSGVKGAWCPPAYPSQAHLPDFLLRRATRQHVRHVMVHGEWVLRDKQHTRLDEAAVTQAVQSELASQAPPTPSPLSAYIRQFYASWGKE